MGQFILAARALMAEVEREKIRERTMRAKNARLAEGRLPTWTCDLYGYRMDRDAAVREIQEDEAEVVRFIYRSVVEGKSLGQIARELNERGVPSPGVERMTYRKRPRTPLWHAGSLQQTITNPAYKGLSVANRFTRVKFRNPDTGRVNGARQVTKPEEEWFYLPDGLTPVIVDAATWDRANERLRLNRGTYDRNKRRPYLLRGVVHCLRCGGAMYSEQEGGKNQRRTYRCGNGKRGTCNSRTRAIADDIEAWVWDEVLYVLRHRDEVVAELRRRQAGSADLSLGNTRTLLSRQLSELEDRQSRLLRGYAEGDSTVPWSLVEREVGRLEQEKAGIAGRLRELEEGLAREHRRAVRLDAVASLIDGLADGDAEHASFEERVRYIHDLGVHIRADKVVWELHWELPVGGASASDDLFVIDLADANVPAGVRRAIQVFTSASRSLGSA